MWDKAEVQELLDVILMLNEPEEARNFLRDLLTEKELQELALRWKTARMLDEKIPYTRIEKETGLSSTTIARISKWLSSGGGGYHHMLKKWQAQSKSSTSISVSTDKEVDSSE